MNKQTQLKLLQEVKRLSEEPEKVKSTYMKIGNIMVFGAAIVLGIIYAITKEINFQVMK